MFNAGKALQTAFEKPPTPRDIRRTQRIEEILEVASMIFVREGYAQFSARRVAAELGIRLSNLQHYCGTTENLLMSIVRAKMNPFVVTTLQIAEDPALTPEQRFLAMLTEDTVATLDTWITSFSFQTWALSDHDEAVAADLKQIYTEYRRIFATVIRQVNPQLSVTRCESFAHLIISQMEGMLVMNKQIDYQPDTWQDTLDTLRTTWLQAISAVPPG